MNRTILFLLTLICLSACHSKPSKLIYVPMRDGMETFYGSIKQVVTEEEGGVQTERSYYVTIDLDKKGDSIIVTRFSHGMDWITKMNAVHDAHGKRTGMLEYYYIKHLGPMPFDNDTASYKRRVDSLEKQVEGRYTCDKNGLIIKYIPESKDVESYTYKYNDDGDMIESETYVKAIETKSVTKFTYDSRHLIVEERGYVKGVLSSKISYTYLAFDSKNNWIKRRASYDSHSGFGGKESQTLERKITYY